MTRMWIDRLPADYVQAKFEAAGRKLDRLHKQGICAHGHIQERTAHNGHMNNTKFKVEFAALNPGQVICLGCGTVFANSGAHQDARDEILA